MSNKANQESICTNGTRNTLQSPQGAENRAGTQTLVDTSAEQKARDLYIQAESCHDRAVPPAEQQAAPKAAPVEPTDSDGFGSAEHWKEKTQYWAGVAHRLRGEALRGEPVDGIVQPAAPQQEAQEPYSIDVDPQGIRALVADAITGALAFGAQGTNAPPDGHWLAPFWAAARAEREAAPVADLHPKTSALVQRFAAALTEKLAAAEKKYGYSDGWASPDWMGECRQKLVEHLAKGDPRDVAAYCAFLWHHRESTTAPASQGDALESEYQRGYRQGYEQRDAEVRGALV